MIVRFWGTRGSLPAPLDAAQVRAKIRAALIAARKLEPTAAIDDVIDALPFSVAGSFGGNSSCVEIDTGGPDHLLCDLGSGARVFSNHMMATHGARPQVYNIFMSHLHWDHIMGFPFFVPAYVAGNLIRIHGCHAELRQAFERQHGAPSFPVEFAALGATIEFVTLEPGRRYEIGGCAVSATKQHHTGDSYGYRFEAGGKSVVYSTDSQHELSSVEDTAPFIALFRDADLVIFDAMLSLADAVSVKADWGHSSNLVGVELAQRARARHLVLFHHEPAHDDAMIERVLAETRRYEEISRAGHAVRVSSAYDGLEIAL